jgi:hypothetical protein
MNYTKINNVGGWITFFLATLVYYFTIEETMSLWDCSEYILSAYKLEVGHPPGAPLFMMLGRLFSFFVSTDQVAFMVNMMSALSSSFTILFMYWTISLLAKKMAFSSERVLSQGQIIAIQSSAFIGAMAYTFTETFWFSAVEGEVYAMASLFTAIILWAIFKWDEETSAIKHGEWAPSASPTRWLILIFFLLGLAIGVHLLGILALPALAYVIYFNKWENTDWKGFILAGVVGIGTLGFVQEGVIPGIVSLASTTEVFFRNSIGLPFNAGVIFFILLVTAGLAGGIVYTQKQGKTILNTALVSTSVLLIGYGSFAMIVIRANADTPMNQNSPKDLVNLHSYLKREQYGSAPLLSGPYWNSTVVDATDGSPKLKRKFTVIKNDDQVASFYLETTAKDYVQKYGGEIKEKYAIIFDGLGINPVYAQGHTTFLPRMFESREPSKIDGYKRWSGYNANGPSHSEKPSIKTADGQRLPTFGENMTYFFNYQIDWMYFRYFMWNFAGRQNDIQGHGDIMQGNWKSGIGIIDNQRLGDQSIAPNFTSSNPSNNSFYFLPLILGLLGLFFHIYKAPKDAFVVFLLFLMTGLAIVMYLNQKPFEPRERDYAYAASFYVFAIWIGLGVYALFEAYRSLSKDMLHRGFMIAGSVTAIFLVRDLVVGEYSASLSMIFITAVGGGAMYLMFALRNVLKQETHAGYLSLVLALVVPVILGVQGWDDHDRGDRTIGLDMAKNYMNSCADNGIIFTHGDNDTFPLWYLQEVEGIKTSVRVYNLSLGQTDWYTEQMTMKVYDSEPLPIKFSKDQYAMYTGSTDNVYFLGSYLDFKQTPEIKEDRVRELISMKIESNRSIFENNLRNASFQLASIMNSSEKLANNNRSAIEKLFAPVEKPGYEEFKYFMELTIAVLQSGEGSGLSRETLEAAQNNAINFEESFDYLPIGYAMEFVRNDDNIISKPTRGGNSINLRFFPSSGFIIPVDNVENMLKHGIVTKEEAKNLEPIRFRMDAQAISREQVMILDILANFEWDRPIYFSNPYPSDVGKALYMQGYVAMEGMVFQLTPVKGKTIDTDKMYDNLTKNYLWGNMDKPGVLLDYYTRRTALQPYKNSMRILADDLFRKFEREKRTNIQSVMNDSVPETKAANRAEDYKRMGVEICLLAFKLMPVDQAIDYGEPSSNLQEAPQGSKLNFTYSYSHGNMHSFVRLLYAFGAKEEADKHGLQVAKELESIMEFTLKSKPAIASQTAEYFFSALDAYLEMYNFSEAGPFQDRAEQYLTGLDGRFKSLINAMRQEDAGKDRERRRYEGAIRDFETRWQALFEMFG